MYAGLRTARRCRGFGKHGILKPVFCEIQIVGCHHDRWLLINTHWRKTSPEKKNKIC